MAPSLPARVARFLIVEVRDWLFAILAIAGAILIPGWTGGSFVLCTLALLVFVAAYLAALFGSRRLFKEDGKTNSSDDPT